MDNKENKRIEEIISSLDGVKRAAVPDFFYTRLRAKMQARQEGVENRFGQLGKRNQLLRPVYIVATLFLLIAINVIAFLRSNNETPAASVENNESVQQSVAAEYSLNDNNTVYDLNQDK